MEHTVTDKKVLRGGEFIVRDSEVEHTFIPEEMNEEQEMVRQTCKDYVANEVRPNMEKIEKQENNIAGLMLEKMGELGILGAHIPEEYGGMPMDTNTNTLIAEEVGASNAVSVAFAAHTGIGMLPILYFGTEEQKQKFLPKLAMGEMKASYCLTEPGSGSDALAAKTRADLNEAGTHYRLNGQKMWITNAGFADVFIVFAKIDGDKFTGFIVERDTKGLSFGAEEDKMGIKGSSTRQVFFENVEVPVANILGEIGKGHLIAFNVLNIGRFKLGALALGAAKKNATVGIKYANERHQFKQPISNFGAIQYKIAEQAIRMFVVESSVYWVSNLLQGKRKEFQDQGLDYAAALLKSAEEYAPECALLKVAGSEALDYVVDETVQIHGGYGFSEEYEAARDYRDSRINRIFEGTNEINRLLLVDMILKRGMKGNFDIVGPAWAVQKELASMPKNETVDGPYAEERKALSQYKKVLLIVAGAAAKAQMDGNLNLKEEQEIVMNIANLAIDVFNSEAVLLRVSKLKNMATKPHEQELYEAIMKVHFNDVNPRIQKEAFDAIASFVEGDVRDIMLRGVRRFTKYTPTNVKVERRKIAAVLIKANEYVI